MTTFEILLQQIGLFVIYILAGVTCQNKGTQQRNTGAHFKICDQNGIAADGFY